MERKNGMKIFRKLIIIASLILPFAIAITRITSGNIAFWYDPARDFFLALSNQQKISLIGQPSGIPGIFYGPYWVWLLSIVLLFFKDPRVVTFIILTIPYFTIFPYLLYKFAKIWGIGISVMLWVLFAFSFDNYQIQLWNPHPAPIITLLSIYLLTTTNYAKTKWKQLMKSLCAGIAAGLLINFHISFGLCVIAGSYLFLLLYRQNVKSLLLFSVGVVFVFVPFFIFELRHDFLQLKTVISTLTSASAVVSEQSGDKLQIIAMFFNRLSLLLNVPKIAGYVLFVASFVYLLVFKINKKLKISEDGKKLLFVIISIALSTLAVYLSSKNPVWEYHFIGVEILFLLFIGFVSKQSTLLRNVFLIAGILLVVFKIQSFAKEFSSNPHKTSSLATKEYIVDTIYNDAEEKIFAVIAYSPAKFTPDFDYLLKWKGEERKNKNLKLDAEANLVYLIIPWTTPDLRDDFIDNKTPSEEYKTAKKWKIPDETLVIKRVRYAKN